MPVIISVLVFIIYYIFDNSGFRMARSNILTVWFGRLISTMVLAPIAIFFTYKSNKDSTVFNFDLYKNALFAMLGIRSKRHIMKKEVIITRPLENTLNSVSDLKHITSNSKEGVSIITLH